MGNRQVSYVYDAYDKYGIVGSGGKRRVTGGRSLEREGGQGRIESPDSVSVVGMWGKDMGKNGCHGTENMHRTCNISRRTCIRTCTYHNY